MWQWEVLLSYFPSGCVYGSWQFWSRLFEIYSTLAFMDLPGCLISAFTASPSVWKGQDFSLNRPEIQGPSLEILCCLPSFQVCIQLIRKASYRETVVLFCLVWFVGFFSLLKRSAIVRSFRKIYLILAVCLSLFFLGFHCPFSLQFCVSGCSRPSFPWLVLLKSPTRWQSGRLDFFSDEEGRRGSVAETWKEAPDGCIPFIFTEDT